MIDEGTTSIVCSYERIWPRGTRTRVVRVYYPPQVLIIDWFLEIRHKGSRLKVPFAVTLHKNTVTRLGKEAIEKSAYGNLVGSAVPKEPSETCSTPKRQYAVDMSLGRTGQAVVSKCHCLYSKQVVHVSVTTPKWTPSASNYCCT